MIALTENKVVAVFKNGVGTFSYFTPSENKDVPEYNPNYDYFDAKKTEVSIRAKMLTYSAEWVDYNLVISEATSYVVIEKELFENILKASNDWIGVKNAVLGVTGTKTEIAIW